MDTNSLASLLETQLEITRQLIIGASESLTVHELESISRRITSMSHSVGHVLALKTLDSEGVVPIGIFVLVLHPSYRGNLH
jgi:hypothetical protein